MAAIKKLDPEGKSLAAHQIALGEIMGRINAGWQRTQSLDMAELLAFLAKETHSAILFDGWGRVANMRSHLANEAATRGDTEGARKLQGEVCDAMKIVWKHCPEANKAGLGFAVAGEFWKARD